MTSEGWPGLPVGNATTEHELELARYQAQLQDFVNRRNLEYSATAAKEAQEADQLNQSVASEDRLREAVHAAYLDVAKSALDRMLRRADAIVTISAAEATIYTTILGLVYSSESRPLSAVAVVPALFMALALVLSASYAGFVSRGIKQGMPLAAGTSARVQHRRLADFVAWVNATALDRGWALQGAVLCLFVSTCTMPVAFIERGQWWVVGLSVVIAVVIGVRARSQSV